MHLCSAQYVQAIPVGLIKFNHPLYLAADHSVSYWHAGQARADLAGGGGQEDAAGAGQHVRLLL